VSAVAGVSDREAARLDGDHHPDPLADDPILFTITPENAASYAENMTAGQLEIMDAYDTYEMNVYTSRRSCAFPEAVYAANRQNSVNASLVAGGNGVDGALLGTPLPIPSEGVEVVWNHNLRYRGHKLIRQFSAFSLSFGGVHTNCGARSGDFTYAEIQRRKHSLISTMFVVKCGASRRRTSFSIMIVPTCFNGSEMVYDLIIGRYTIQGLKNQEPMINFFADELDESQSTLAGVWASAARRRLSLVKSEKNNGGRVANGLAFCMLEL